MRLIATAMLAVLVTACLLPATSEAAKKPKDNVVVLAFGAKWCGACQKMKPTLAKIERKGYTVVYVNVETEKGRKLASKYNVSALPTCVIVDANGHEQGRTEGLVSEGVLLGLLKVARKVLLFAIKVLLF